jgi:2',3'-cyclic-nucleotide 2'-phosphodiesterase (5'-nucleotidase family)
VTAPLPGRLAAPRPPRLVPFRVAPLAALLVAACAPAPELPAPAEAVRVRVVHTNDFHGHLLPQPPGPDGQAVGGSAVLAAHFDSARIRFDGPTLLLSAGDVMQGTALSNLSWGRAAIAAYNNKGYDAAAVGNHEFDWGQDTLQARIAESGFPWLAANLFEAGTDRHPAWVRPWIMIERQGVRVAVVGLALETTPRVVMAGRTDGLEFGAAPAAVDRYAAEAWAHGADFVVVTAHMGATCQEPGDAPTDPSRGCRGRLMDVASEVTQPVDLWVGGHTHLRNLTDVAGVPVSQALRYGVAYGVTDLERRDGRTRVLRQAIEPAWAHTVDPDTAMVRFVEEWAAAIRPMTERVVATLAEPMSNFERRAGEWPLGTLIAEAQRVAAGADVGFVNVGSIRRGLPAGPVTYGMLFELQPFQNELVSVALTGALLKDALELGLDREGRPRVHVSGLTVRYDPGAPAGSRIRAMILDDGREIGPRHVVTVGTTEFVAAGGDGFQPFGAGEQVRTGMLDLDALVTYLESFPGPLPPPATGRWQPVR